jgi:thiol:disulfide interchange protein DsbD
MLGFYLLGKLKFAHDSDLPHISVARLFLSVASFAFAVYMVPGLFGAPLKGISSLLPPETEPSVQLRQDSASPGDQEGINRNISAGNCGPAKYSDFLQLPYGLQGYFDYDEGMECARQLNKPVLLDFKGHACGTCKVMEAKVWSDPAVLERLKDDFVIIALYVDDKTRIPANELAGSGSDKASKMTLGRKNLDFQISKFNTNTLPYYIVVDPDGNPLNQAIGYEPNASRYTSFLDDGLKNFRR